eukprot:TRINITY_DN60_c0_g1_i2.p1 TRINITY_DN60_c0_g1~~TRINITY_DN60_c0_g1_i2.p1  ORF type:complete len:404 (+),score=131.31 TRINITY_DN60_c0_g1_i2:146-1357(+)
MPRVGKYELGKTVGKGAFSKVKVATNVDTGAEFVIKIIDKRGGDGDKSEQKVEAEVKHEISIMKVLNHENIVRMFEVMESSKHFYIVLESVRGGDLCDHIMDSGKLQERQASKYLHHLVEGLLACHAAGVAHRDIKPENCLISLEGVLKVADFGLSRLHRGRGDIADASEMATDSVGTLSYAAPEVLNGHYNAFKADLWSTGVVIFVMVTGKFPFGSKGYTDSQIRADIRKAKVNRFPSHVSADAKDLVMRLIVLEPEQRVTLEGILDHPWLAAEMAGTPRSRDRLPAIPGAGTPAPGSSGSRRKPLSVDVEQVMADAKAMETEGRVVDETMSPTWQDSPAGKMRPRYQPALMTPHSPTAPREGQRSPRQSPRNSPRHQQHTATDIQTLKQALDLEAAALQGK